MPQRRQGRGQRLDKILGDEPRADVELPGFTGTTGQIDPYARVSTEFAPMLANLGCNLQAQRPPAGASPLSIDPRRTADNTRRVTGGWMP